MSNDDSGRWALVTVTDNAGSPFDSPRRVMEVRPAENQLAVACAMAERAAELEGKAKG